MIAARSVRAAARVARSGTQSRMASGAPHYHQPSGYIFSEQVPKGQKRVRESWETLYYVGMFGGMALATAVVFYRPDTSIQTWALQEAKERMAARGESVEYKPSQ